MPRDAARPLWVVRVTVANVTRHMPEIRLWMNEYWRLHSLAIYRHLYIQSFPLFLIFINETSYDITTTRGEQIRRLLTLLLNLRLSFTFTTLTSHSIFYISSRSVAPRPQADWMIPGPCIVYLSRIKLWCVCVCVCGAGVLSPRTFAAGRGLGSGRGCWRRVTSWAAASPTSRWAAGGAAGKSPSVPPPPPAAGHTHTHTQVSCCHVNNISEKQGRSAGCFTSKPLNRIW